MNGVEGRITFFSAVMGVFLGTGTFIVLSLSGVGRETAFPAALLVFAVVMLATHVIISIRDALDERRYQRYEHALGEEVQARFIANIIEGENMMGGMIYLLSAGRILLSSVSRSGLWETMVRPGEIHHVEQMDMVTLQIQCLDGRVYRIMTMPAEELLDAFSMLGISVVRPPMM